MSDPIVVVDYDLAWPEVFELLRAGIGRALGKLVNAIEHIGSTAIPGVAAKPVIDIDVLLTFDASLPEAIDILASLGYGHRGNLGIAGREAFRAPAGQPAHHLYVCPFDSREFQRHVAFRDYLRAHPQSARDYGELKRGLAELYRNDRDSYNSAKSEFVNEILRHTMSKGNVGL